MNRLLGRLGYQVVRKDTLAQMSETELRAIEAISKQVEAIPVTPGKQYIPASDPVFSQFRRWRGPVKGGFDVGFLGEMMDLRFDASRQRADRMEDRFERPSYPAMNDEAFEWLALLSSVLEARERFVMVEAGAGHGRWIVSAACAIRQRFANLPFTLMGIEAEPTHYGWMAEHLRNNDLDPEQHRLIPGAVSARDGSVDLLVDTDPAGWYGQTLTTTPEGRTAPRDRLQTLTVRSYSLKTLLAEFETVDFLDMDIQGAEEQAIIAGIDAMTEKVRRAFIATHAPQIEVTLSYLFMSHGWRCVHRFPCRSIAATEYGPVEFQDGVQHWINPRL